MSGPAGFAGGIGEQPNQYDQLRWSQARLAHSQHAAGLGSWELDPRTGAVTCSEEMYEIFGLDPKVFVPSLASFIACVHPDDQELVGRAVTQATETRAPVRFTHRVVRPDGTIRVIQASADVLLREDGSVHLICGTDQDITALRAIQDELRRQNETLDLITRAANDAVWECLFPSWAMIWHHGLEEYGYPPDTVASLSDSWSSLIHPDDRERVRSSAEAALAMRAPGWSDRFRLRRADGSDVPVLARGQIVRDQAGAPLRMVGSLLDLTEHERLQDLDRRNEASAVVFGRASHELRTPLNAILGFSELLEEQLRSTLTDRQLRYVQNIRAAGTQLLGLVDDVLDLSKAVSGRIELAPEDVGLVALLEPVLATARERAAATGIDLSGDARGDPRLCVDAARVRQVLDNLLANALKFTPAGGRVVLTASVEGRSLHLTVSDTGYGIAAERQARVFGAFETLHDDHPAIAGSGLGLALSRHLVELHGGSITFRSNDGPGTTFSVVLPDVLQGSSPDDRVLIVEDRRPDAALMVELVAVCGLATEVARSLADGRRAIARALPRAVILDLQLPDGRGEELLQDLRADPLTQALPVIVVTGEGDARRSRVEGADEQLSKPLDHARLRGWLERVAAPSATLAGVPVHEVRAAS